MLAFILQESTEQGIWQTLQGYWGDTPWYWIVIGFGGQAIFFSRFLVQWLASEKAKRSVVPTAFWWLSICGAVMILTYAVFVLRDPVIILGQTSGTLIYTRNLQLIHRQETVD